jgi:hypothetical protein
MPGNMKKLGKHENPAATRMHWQWQAVPLALHLTGFECKYPPDFVSIRKTPLSIPLLAICVRCGQSDCISRAEACPIAYAEILASARHRFDQ